MKSKFGIFLLIFSLHIGGSLLFAQDLDGLLKSDYTNQQRLLIKSEVRKLLGDKANSPRIKELTNTLIPWAMMEEMSPKDFATSLYFVNRAEEAGVSFATVEDVFPLLPKFKGIDRDFLLLASFMKETETANLSPEIRDYFLSGAIQRNWEGLSIVFGGRLLLLSRRERREPFGYIDLLQKKLPARISAVSKEKLSALFFELSSDFKSARTANSRQVMSDEILKIQDSKGLNLDKSLRSSYQIMEPVLTSFGEMEMRERPRLEWSPDDLGIVEVQLPEDKDWRSVSLAKLDKVVSGWIGTRYVYGGSVKTGTDCSGFTRAVLTDPMISVPLSLIPRGARDQSRIGILAQRSTLKGGELVFFSASPNEGKITHVGLSMGGPRFAHASSSKGVIIQSLDDKWWTGRFNTARRIFSKVDR